MDREDLFLTTKVWRSNRRHEEVIDSVEESLEKLGVDALDGDIGTRLRNRLPGLVRRLSL